MCKVEWCNTEEKTNGYCHKHYMQMYRHGKISERTKYDKNKIVKHKDYAEIIIYDPYGNKKNTSTKIDLQDVDIVKKHKWYISGNGYIRGWVNKEKVYLARFLLQPKNDLVVDHISGDVSDNRRSNLRICTHQQNCMNRFSNKIALSKYKGVTFDKSKDRWKAVIGLDRKYSTLGYFEDEKDAAIAYNNEVNKYHGIYGKKNFID